VDTRPLLAAQKVSQVRQSLSNARRVLSRIVLLVTAAASSATASCRSDCSANPGPSPASIVFWLALSVICQLSEAPWLAALAVFSL
jgi:hypothetical protein